MTITIKQGDTRHAIKAKLADVSGNVIDLTGASVRFAMVSITGVPVIDRQIEQAGDEVWVVFEDGETDRVGMMHGEFRVDYPDGRVEHFPHDGYLRIHIKKNKGGTLNGSE